MTTKKAIKKSERAVVVTTAHRGVFVGHTTEPSNTVGCIDLVRAHMVLYWAAGSRGILGLATKGPVAGSRVSPQVKSMGLRDVTSIMDATDEAVAAWEKMPWS